MRSKVTFLSMAWGWIWLVGCTTPQSTTPEPRHLFTVEGRTEGIVFDAKGFGYVSHGPHITRFTFDGRHEIWATTGGPNGHKILPDGTHLVCETALHAVLKISPDGKTVSLAADRCDGKPLREPNDLTLDLKFGGFYFTDPGDSNASNRTGTVHYVDARGQVRLVASGLAYPNGILLRPDGKTLLVAESMTNLIHEYPVILPGRLGNPRIFAKLPEADTAAGQVSSLPDGMCMDEHGNIYIAHWGMKQVQVLSPRGELIARINAGNLMASNCGFGGPGLPYLFLTGGLTPDLKQGGLFRHEMNVRGP